MDTRAEPAGCACFASSARTGWLSPLLTFALLAPRESPHDVRGVLSAPPGPPLRQKPALQSTLLGHLWPPPRLAAPGPRQACPNRSDPEPQQGPPKTDAWAAGRLRGIPHLGWAGSGGGSRDAGTRGRYLRVYICRKIHRSGRAASSYRYREPAGSCVGPRGFSGSPDPASPRTTGATPPLPGLRKPRWWLTGEVSGAGSLLCQGQSFTGCVSF